MSNDQDSNYSSQGSASLISRKPDEKGNMVTTTTYVNRSFSGQVDITVITQNGATKAATYQRLEVAPNGQITATVDDTYTLPVAATQQGGLYITNIPHDSDTRTGVLPNDPVAAANIRAAYDRSYRAVDASNGKANEQTRAAESGVSSTINATLPRIPMKVGGIQ